MVDKLILIQKELKAPKGQYNSFAKFKYRSAEDILEAVKPLCHKHDLALTISDTLEQIGDRHYVKATATITDGQGHGLSVCGYAREDAEKKGMDGSQITGAASSYARKYALNGLFCIDDTKDADTDEHRKVVDRALGESDKKALKEWKDLETVLYDMALVIGLDDKEFPAFFKKKYKVDISRATIEQLKQCQTDINMKIDEAQK